MKEFNEGQEKRIREREKRKREKIQFIKKYFDEMTHSQGLHRVTYKLLESKRPRETNTHEQR